MVVNKVLTAYEKGDAKTLITLLEKQALAASTSSDVDAFRKTYPQLKSLYNLSAKSPNLTKNSTTVIALHLLILLSSSETSQFHSELESLPSKVTHSAEVQWVRTIEQGITEGSYTDVRQSLTTPPNKHFEKWGASMIESIRTAIADSSESSYDSLPIVNLTTLLLLASTKETEQFAKARNWTVKSGRVWFPKHEDEDELQPVTTKASGMEVDDEQASVASHAETMIQQTLGYARELESIV